MHIGNFDNIGYSMLILFEVAMLEGWQKVMYVAMDTQGEGMPLKKENNPAASIFFVIFLLTCAFFVMAMFVGVVVDEYHKYHEKYTSGHITDGITETIFSLFLFSFDFNFLFYCNFL